MCGIFGSITKKDVVLTEQQKAVRQNIVTALGFAMQERGDHSTGIAVVRNGDLSMRKRAVCAYEFLHWKKAKRLLRDNPTMVIGHTRFATTGEVTDENAHPFIIGDICGVHNGQVSNYKDIGEDLNVDSEAIFTALDNNDGDYKKAFLTLQGSMAIAWMKKQDPYTLHLVSHKNPLAICRVKQLDTIFYCSTPEAMQIVVHAGVGYDHNEIFEPNEDTVYTINGDLKISKDEVEFKEYAWGGTGYTADTPYGNYSPSSRVSDDYYSIRDEAQDAADMSMCDLCGRPYANLQPNEKKQGIYYDYKSNTWICSYCKKSQGESFIYQKMTYEEYIEDLMWEIEVYSRRQETASGNVPSLPLYTGNT